MSVNFKIITFDKYKIHNYFNTHEKEISYSDINEKEFYILPILIGANEILFFSNNNFYENWKKKEKRNKSTIENS